MNDYLNIQYWKTSPDRDEALERIYGFVRSLKIMDNDDKITEVFVHDVQQLRHLLNDTLKQYLQLSIEDSEWEYYEARDLSFEVDDPFGQDEDLIYPIFSGKNFVLGLGENISIKLGLNGYITPVRLHFMLVEADELFYLRLSRITAE